MNKFSVIRKIDDIGRIVIPKQLRERCNIKSNDKLNFRYLITKQLNYFLKIIKQIRGKYIYG